MVDDQLSYQSDLLCNKDKKYINMINYFLIYSALFCFATNDPYNKADSYR